MDLIKPKRVRTGGTVRLVAPSISSGVIEPGVWEIGLRRLESKGLNVEVAGHVLNPSGSAEERAGDVMDAFSDPEVDLVISVSDGYSSSQLLPYLDYKVIRECRKPFIGNGDVTALNNAILTRSGLVNFYGPAFMTFCWPELPAYTERSFDLMLLEGSSNVPVEASDTWAEYRSLLKDPLGPREWRKNRGWEVLNEGHAKGRAVGGNLSTLLLLAETEYWPDMNGTILFLEDDGTSRPGIYEQNITHLKDMGVMDKVYGLVVGRFPTEMEFSGKDPRAVMIGQLLGDCDIPIVSGVDIGHTDPMLTIPLGVRCELSTDKKRMTFVERAVD
jgi:muramoyltetrapeptide carboxypeptidase